MGTNRDEIVARENESESGSVEADLLVSGVAGEDEEVVVAPLNSGKLVFIETVEQIGIFDLGELGELFEIGGSGLIDVDPATIAYFR